jgi:6-pyruvoyltetrahydropterin/6-carboxytetrahydropterin synthase
MRFLISKEFKFDSAHNLVGYNGKCENLHGHTYRLKITFEGDIKEDGMIIDFTILKKIIKEKIINILDHRYLNEIIKQPTAENIALWIYNELKDDFEKYKVKISEINLWETEDSSVTLKI